MGFSRKKTYPLCVESFEVDKSGFMSYFGFFIITSFKNFSLLIVEFSKIKFNVCFLKCLSTPCPSPLHWNKKLIFSTGRWDFLSGNSKPHSQSHWSTLRQDDGMENIKFIDESKSSHSKQRNLRHTFFYMHASVFHMNLIYLFRAYEESYLT